MNKHIILGTAGHIDHGKTTLIRALTGILTDRLPEEQKRGITIELGFAHLSLPDGTEVGIVDVPGHEKFVHHMVAGVGGMDLVMLVIAADEGIMPQTREHLQICELLGVRKGFVALTKIDMVEPDWLELVTEDIEDHLSDTFLAGAPIVPVSGISGTGLDDIRRVLVDRVTDIQPRQAAGPFRLPIDRVFTIRGFGTVITGTVASGQITAAETVAILPGDRECRIRGMQVHGKDADRVQAGQRAAVNLQNVEKDQIHRGMMLTRRGTMPESYMVDARCRLIKDLDKPLKNRARIRFHTGTSEIPGRIVLMDADVLKPGDAAFVQFRLASPTANLPGDRFIIRSYSPVITLGGGEILDAEPVKHKRFRERTRHHFQQLQSRNPMDRLDAWLVQADIHGLSRDDLKRRYPDPELDMENLLDTARSSDTVHYVDGSVPRYIADTAWQRAKTRLLAAVEAYQRQHGLRGGINREELKSRLKPLPPQDVLDALLADMISSDELIETNNRIRTPDFSVDLSPDEDRTYRRILDILADAGLSGSTLKTMTADLNIPDAMLKRVFQYVLDQDQAVRLPNGLILNCESMDRARSILLELMEANGTVTVATFRDAAGISRKQSVPILEYFDAVGLTRRRGDARILR